MARLSAVQKRAVARRGPTDPGLAKMARRVTYYFYCFSGYATGALDRGAPRLIFCPAQGGARNDGPHGRSDREEGGVGERTCAAHSAPPVRHRFAITLDNEQALASMPTWGGRATPLAFVPSRIAPCRPTRQQATAQTSKTAQQTHPNEMGEKKKQIATPTKNKQAVSY